MTGTVPHSGKKTGGIKVHIIEKMFLVIITFIYFLHVPFIGLAQPFVYHENIKNVCEFRATSV